MTAIPPFRFEAVEENIYRGAYPTLRNFTFLSRLKLRCIVSLIPEKPSTDLKKFAKIVGADIISYKVRKYKESVSMTPDLVRKIIETLIKPELHPLYIHCIDGLHVTGLVVMCLRKLEYWTTQAIHEEFSRFVPEHAVPADEAKFLAQFDGGTQGILIPKTLPAWLWQGIRISRHPSIKIVATRPKNSEVPPSKPRKRIPPVERSPPEMLIRNMVNFVDPLASSDISSIASFDTLLCSPHNLGLLGTFQGHSPDTPPLSPRGEGDLSIETFAGGANEFGFHHPGSRGFDPVGAILRGEQVHFRYSPCPYVLELLRDDSEKLSPALRALAVEGLSAGQAGAAWYATSLST